MTDAGGDEVMVDKAFVLQFDEEGNPGIIARKSALPVEAP